MIFWSVHLFYYHNCILLKPISSVNYVLFCFQILDIETFELCPGSGVCITLNQFKDFWFASRTSWVAALQVLMRAVFSKNMLAASSVPGPEPRRSKFPGLPSKQWGVVTGKLIQSNVQLLQLNLILSQNFIMAKWS